MKASPANTTLEVDVITGGFSIHAVDLVIPALGFDFRLERWYSTLRNFSFQNGWRYGWDEYLLLDPSDGSVTHYTPAAEQSRFVRNPDGTYNPAVAWITSRLQQAPDGRMLLTLKNQERHYFDPLGTTSDSPEEWQPRLRLRQRVDTHGNAMTYTWAGGEIASITDGAGRRLHIYQVDDPDGSSDLVVRDWTGRTLTYRTSQGNLVSYTDPEGHVTTYGSYNTGFVGPANVTFPNGTWVTNVDAGGVPMANKVAQQTFGNGRVVSYSYDWTNRTAMVDDGGRITTYEWDADGNITQVTDPMGNVRSYLFDANNRLIQVTFPDLSTVSYTWDSMGNMLTYTDQKGNTWTYEYHPVFNKVTKITGPAPSEFVTEMTYDASTGDLLTVTDPLANVTEYEYYANGLLQTLTDPNLNTWQFSYDAWGALTQVLDGLGKATEFSYDQVGNQTAMTDPLGNTSTRTYDRTNRVTSVTTPLGNVTRLRYDGNGNVVGVTDARNRGTQFAYSVMNELLQVTDPAGGTVSYAYDLFHNLVQQADPNGHTYTFEYDALDRQTKSTDPMGQVTTTAWDPYCGTYTVTNPEDEVASYSRDVTCRLTERAFQDGSSFQFTYDEEGRRTGMTQAQAKKFGEFLFGAQEYGFDPDDDVGFAWDGDNRLTEVTFPGPLAISLEWDDAGRLVKITDIHSMDTEYGWDDANRLVSVTRDGKTTTYVYDDTGRLVLLTYPNGVTCTYTYDADSRLLRLHWELDSDNLYDIQYSYDATSNRTRRSMAIGTDPAVVEDYAYDALQRLTRVDEDGVPRHQYRFDRAGNRLLKSRPEARFGICGADEYSDYDASDELVATNQVQYRWDRVGRLAKKDDPAEAAPTLYAWNYASRLRQVTLPDATTAEYRYNGDELRIYRKEPDITEHLYYWVPTGPLGLPQVLNETDAAGNPRADYILGPMGLLGLADASGDEHYYITDALGSVLALTDEIGAVTDTYAYDEYGVPTATTGTSYNPLRYTGQQFDPETGFYYLRNRHYAPEWGRFVRRDPAPLDCNRNGCQAWPWGREIWLGQYNAYGYARQNGINYFDPTGEVAVIGAILPWLGAVLAGVGVGRTWACLRALGDVARKIDEMKPLLDRCDEDTAKKWDLIRSTADWYVAAKICGNRVVGQFTATRL